MREKITHTGGCHCGAVTFEVQAPAKLEALACNCSICDKVGFLHVFATKEELRILSGKDNLVTYTFNTGVAQHYFCKTCGVKPFYVPRSHPDGWSVNARCINKETVLELIIKDFDGANWEKNVETIR